MKKKFVTFAFTFLICFCTLCGFCFAQSAFFEPDEETGEYNITYSGKTGEMYLLTIVKGEITTVEGLSLSDEDIVYINQATAKSDGTAIFSDILLKDSFSGIGTVIIRGTDLPSPVIIGYVDKKAEGAYTITVPADSNVYFADGSVMAYAEETQISVPKTNGYIVVNTGLNTKHTVYSVTDGIPTEDKELADALFNTGKSSIRSPANASDERQGLRFLSTIADDAAALDRVVEFGYMVTAETAKMNFSEGYILNKTLVDEGKAKMTVARSKADDISIIYGHDVNAELTLFTTVVYGMPKTYEGYTTNIVSRPYYKLSEGTYIYGEVSKRTLYDVAKAIKNAEDKTDYNNNKAYIDEIIYTVETTIDDSFTDVEGLLSKSSERIIASSTPGVDTNGYYRNYYTIINPFTGWKETDIPGKIPAKTVAEIPAPIGVGRIAKVVDGYVLETGFDDTQSANLTDENQLLWIKSFDTQTGVLETTSVFDDWHDAQDAKTGLYKVTDKTSVISVTYTSAGTSLFTWGSTKLVDTEDLASDLNKYKCYNDKIDDGNGLYKTGYAMYKKAYVNKDASGNVNYIVILVHANENPLRLKTNK